MSCLVYNQFNYLLNKFGYRLRALATGVLYQKCLRISSVSSGKYSLGEIVNLVSVDANRFSLLGI